MPRVNNSNGETDAEHQGKHEPAEGLDKGNDGMMAQNRQFLEERSPEIARRRQNKGRHLDDLDKDLPQNQKHREKEQRFDNVFDGSVHGENSAADVKGKPGTCQENRPPKSA